MMADGKTYESQLYAFKEDDYNEWFYIDIFVE